MSNTVSFNDDVQTIANAVSTNGKQGFIYLTDLPNCPLGDLKEAFDQIDQNPCLGERLNSAYTRNLIYKDSFKQGYGGENIDMKRVLDLSPSRLTEINKVDPNVVGEIGSSLNSTLAWYSDLSTLVKSKLLESVAIATSNPSLVNDDAHTNFRMLDYYERPLNSVAPRCSPHHDFSTFALIFQDKCGLEISVNDEWVQVFPKLTSTAVMLFGKSIEIRSNGRVVAPLHRVVDTTIQDNVFPRRTSAVFFVAPKEYNTQLAPVVLESECQQFLSVKMAELRGPITKLRDWRFREVIDSESLLTDQQIKVY